MFLFDIRIKQKPFEIYIIVDKIKKLQDAGGQHNYLGHGKKSVKFFPCSIWRCLFRMYISLSDYPEMAIFLVGDIHNFTSRRLVIFKV